MSLVPSHYKLQFDVDLTNFVFKGKEVLEFALSEDENTLELDALELEVEECLLFKKKQIIDTKITQDKQKGKIIIRPSKRLDAGMYILKFVYSGTINDHLAGLYRSKYRFKNREKYIATTQFEAADARRAFVCLDNPAYKATFEVTIICDKRFTSLSNTLPLKEYIKNGRRYTQFDRTPRMSTYLLYLGIGEFELKKTKYKNVLLRGVTTKGQSKHTSYALEWTKKCLAYYENFFGHNYPLKKLDLIGVPDFASGAMENWGAITFRETALLYFEGQSAIATKQRVAEVVAHELVHQWFGNLVTMKWWDDLWLNESFATYMAYKAMAHFYPEWNVWTEYVTYSSFGGMALDSLQSSHPIHVKVNSVDEIDELFDEIAYEKGGSVLRMLDHYLGEHYFMKGLKRYIKTYAYSNTAASDLWSSLEKESRKPVISIMERYVNQVGFPLVSVENKNRSIQITQKRFLYEKKKTSELWEIPIVLKSGKKIAKNHINTTSATLNYPSEKGIMINADYAGFYISQYSPHLLGLLGKNRDTLNEREALGLIHDLFSLVLAQSIDLKEFLSYLETFYYDEQDYEVLAYLIAKLLGIYKLLRRDTLGEVCIDLAKAALQKTGYEPNDKEDVRMTDLRNVALSALIQTGEVDGLAYVAMKFKNYLKNNKTLHPDLKSVVYAGAVAADKRYYEKVKQLYLHADAEEERVKLLNALTSAQDRLLLKSTLVFSLSSEVRFSNMLYVLAGASGNKIGKDLVYSWFMKNWEELKSRTGGHSKTILRRLMKIVLPICGIEHEDEVKLFLQKNPIIGLEQTYLQIVEELRINAAFVHRYVK